MYYVYIIYSQKLNRYYTGTTDDLEKRLSQHNSGFYSKAFTQKGIPWVLKIHFPFENGDNARFAEKFIKRMKSRTFILKIIDDPEYFMKIVENKVRIQLRGFGAASSTKP